MIGVGEDKGGRCEIGWDEFLDLFGLFVSVHWVYYGLLINYYCWHNLYVENRKGTLEAPKLSRISILLYIIKV